MTTGSISAEQAGCWIELEDLQDHGRIHGRIVSGRSCARLQVGVRC